MRPPDSAAVAPIRLPTTSEIATTTVEIDEREPRAPQNTRENVAAERVASKRMRAAGSGEDVCEIDRQRIGVKQCRTHNRRQNDRDDDSHSNSQ